VYFLIVVKMKTQLELDGCIVGLSLMPTAQYSARLYMCATAHVCLLRALDSA